MILQSQESVPENFHEVSVDGKKLLRDEFLGRCRLAIDGVKLARIEEIKKTRREVTAEVVGKSDDKMLMIGSGIITMT